MSGSTQAAKVSLSLRATARFRWPCAAVRGASVTVIGFCLGLTGANAQLQDDEPFYATGALVEPPEVLERIPVTPEFRSYLPQAVSLEDRMPVAGNQGRWGSCVAWAVGYAARSYYERSAHGRQISRADNLVSPSWLHHIIRADPADCEGGSWIYRGLDQLKTGAVSLADYPYNDQQCVTVSQSEAQSATEFRIRDYRQVDTQDLDQIKGQLALGHPVIFAARLNREFMRSRGRTTWRATPELGDFAGNHAMTLTGYDDRMQLFTFINSWGVGWGDKGYGTMNYDTFKARVYSAFVIEPLAAPIRPTPLEPDPPPQPQVRVLSELGFECAQVFERPGDPRPGLGGFVSTPEDLATLKAQYTKTHDIEVGLRPWPQCEALLILTEGRIEAEGPSIDIAQTEYTEGDPFVFSIDAPDFSSHLHLSYFQADGSVVHLMQSAGTQLRTLLPRARITMGDGLEGRPAFQVSGPFGDEMLLAITTKSPLFTQARPQLETERDFLSALRAATIAFEDDGEGRYYASRSVAIKTRGESE